jgi:thiol-disulfide isomerase/thioredoxin
MLMKLQVVVATHCPNCDIARGLAEELASAFPDLTVELIDIDVPGTALPPAAFAVPTFVLNDRVLWLGNPDPREAVAELRERLRKHERVAVTGTTDDSRRRSE